MKLGILHDFGGQSFLFKFKLDGYISVATSVANDVQQ
jgi:hypothetical protein